MSAMAFRVLVVCDGLAEDVCNGETLTPVYDLLGGLDSGGGVRDYWLAESIDGDGTEGTGGIAPGRSGHLFAIEPDADADQRTLGADIERAMQSARTYPGIVSVEWA